MDFPYLLASAFMFMHSFEAELDYYIFAFLAFPDFAFTQFCCPRLALLSFIIQEEMTVFIRILIMTIVNLIFLFHLSWRMGSTAFILLIAGFLFVLSISSFCSNLFNFFSYEGFMSRVCPLSYISAF